MKAAASGVERRDLLLLGLVNARVALLCFSGADSIDVAVQSIEDDLGADAGKLRGELERSLQLAEALLAELEEPARKARAEQRRLWALAVAPLLVVALAVGAAGWKAFGARELSIGRPWKTSSTGLICDPARRLCDGRKTGIFFHTAEDAEPWFEIDLGQEYALSRIEVQNRSDCCAERALPLLVEVSLDQVQYRVVARKFASFDVWKQALSSNRARYVRLRVPRRSVLHLEQVRVFGRRLD